MTQLKNGELGLPARLVAAAWFAGTAFIPIMLFLLFLFVQTDSQQNAESGLKGSWFFVGLPVSLAAFFGFAIGYRILDFERTRSGFRAMLRGIVVAVSSYLAMPALDMFGVSVFSQGGFPQHHSIYMQMYWVLLIYGVGAVLVGWLIVIAGAVGGYLLERVSHKERLREIVATARVSPGRAYAFNAAAALFLVVFNASLLLFPSLISGSIFWFFRILDHLAPLP
jgi:hypothetical protein